MTPKGLPRLALAAALPIILSGCAAAAIPLAAGALFANGGMGDVAGIGLGGERTSGSPVPTPDSPNETATRVAIFKPQNAPRSGLSSSATLPESKSTAETAPAAALTATVEPASPPPEPRFVAFTDAFAPPPAPSPRPTELLPVSPSAATGADPYAAFARYALDKAQPSDQPRLSVLVDPDTLTSKPRLAECDGQPLAVLLDLDPGAEPFDLDNPPLPTPGLAERLSAIRNAGITVLWSASLPVSSAEQLYTTLSASGLDPARTDRLLLIRNDEERKQTRRFAAGHDWCILAAAGDRRADFDEVFDYLRDPEGPIAQALDPNFGAGWFLAPPPID